MNGASDACGHSEAFGCDMCPEHGVAVGCVPDRPSATDDAVRGDIALVNQAVMYDLTAGNRKAVRSAYRRLLARLSAAEAAAEAGRRYHKEHPCRPLTGAKRCDYADALRGALAAYDAVKERG
jgi:hypothetical protein